MPKFLFQSYPSQLEDVPAVIRTMKNINDEIKRTDFANLYAFNQTYLIITENVYSKIGTGFFQYDQKMKQFDINFAYYYFDALKAYLETNSTTPAWQVLFEKIKQNKCIQIEYMALGVNAHVNNDLALSLYDCRIPEMFSYDYDKVNEIIIRSIPSVLHDLNCDSLKFTQSLLSKIIISWRSLAWKRYQSLLVSQTNKKEIEYKARDIKAFLSPRLLWIS